MENYASIKNPDDLQSIANLIRFFRIYKWSARKMSITDKMVKNGRLSVKCVLLTDKSAKNGILSVKLSEILVEQHYFLKDVFLRAKMDVVFNRGLSFTGRSQKSSFCP